MYLEICGVLMVGCFLDIDWMMSQWYCQGLQWSCNDKSPVKVGSRNG